MNQIYFNNGKNLDKFHFFPERTRPNFIILRQRKLKTFNHLKRKTTDQKYQTAQLKKILTQKNTP